MVFHVPTFFSELAVLEKKGLKNVHDRIFVSDRVTIDLDLHIAVDGLEEVCTLSCLSCLPHVQALYLACLSSRLQLLLVMPMWNCLCGMRLRVRMETIY